MKTSYSFICIEKKCSKLKRKSILVSSARQSSIRIRLGQYIHTRCTIYQYEEQGDDLDVVFKCEDGEQKCSHAALHFMSDYYADQLAARERMNNPSVFNYQYPKEMVKFYILKLCAVNTPDNEFWLYNSNMNSKSSSNFLTLCTRQMSV